MQNEKNIIIIDKTSKLLLLLIAAGVWFMALKPVKEFDSYEIEKQLKRICEQLFFIKSEINDIEGNMPSR
jgi:hypothetical protein